MKRYNIKMDGQMMPNSYTYAELEDMGIFEFDGIEIKQTTEFDWTDIRCYYFSEKEPTSVSSTTSQSQYRIDEFGQVIRTGHASGTNSSSSSSTNSTSSSSSTNSTSRSTNDDGFEWWEFFRYCFWQTIGTILVIGIYIAMIVGIDEWDFESLLGYFLLFIFIVYPILKKIWD